MSPKKLKEYDTRGVGLLASGAYVLSSFPAERLEEVAAQQWSGVSWDDERRIIIIRSKARGAQARFGKISRDGRWLAYPTFPPAFGSVGLFHAEVETIPHFVRRAVDGGAKVWDVRKPTAASTKKLGRGFLVSPDPESRHNALLCCDADGLHLIPFELEPPAHATTEFGQLTPVSDSEARAITALFEPILAGTAVFDHRYKNTSLFYRKGS
jgi:hypothetical protein